MDGSLYGIPGFFVTIYPRASLAYDQYDGKGKGILRSLWIGSDFSQLIIDRAGAQSLATIG
jgi:hypothetical protein